MADKSELVTKVHKIADVHCSNCGLASLCLPIALTYAEMERLDSIIERTPPLKKGQHLFYQGDTFTSIYAVRAGTVKTYTVTNDGEEQITGFYFPGELIGLNGIDTRYYPASAKVLETTTVCEIPYDCLDELAGQLPELRRQLMRTMGREIREEQQMMLLLSKKTAEERVATFLLKLSNRFKQRGYSPCLFRLSMSRNEIGNYLGLAVETVSRIFTRFQKLGIIRVEGKEVNILQPEQLLETSGEGRKEDGLRQKSSA